MRKYFMKIYWINKKFEVLSVGNQKWIIAGEVNNLVYSL